MIQILFLGQEIHFLELALFDTGLNHHIPLVINDHVQLFARQTKQVTDFVGQGTEIPNMGNGYHQLDMSNAIATHLLFGDLHPASIADDAFVADTLVLTTMAFVILYRTKNALTEQATHFRLVGPVINGFGFDDLPLATLQDGFRRRKPDADFGKIALDLPIFSKRHGR